MFWRTCQYHQPFVARLIQDCHSGISRTCRPSLTKGKLQKHQPIIIQSPFFRSSHSLPAGMKFLFSYRPYHKTSVHMFDKVVYSNQLKRNFSSSPFWLNSLFQYQDNSRPKNSNGIPLFVPVTNSLKTSPVVHCPQSVSSSLTSSSSNGCLQPFTIHSIINAKFYSTQSKNSPNQDTTSSPISFNSEPDKSQHLPRSGDLKEDIQTIPNLLTCCRMASAPFVSYLILNSYFSWALGLLVCAGITDVLDGYIARNFKNQNSMLGTALDPLADKILISFLSVSLTMVDLIPLPLLLVIIGRDLGLIGIFFYIRYVSLPPPKTIKRYFDVTHSTAEISPSLLSKVNTAIQLSLLGLSVAAPVFGFVDHVFLQTLWYITASTTILSACGYVRERNNVIKILGADSNLKPGKK